MSDFDINTTEKLPFIFNVTGTSYKNKYFFLKKWNEYLNKGYLDYILGETTYNEADFKHITKVLVFVDNFNKYLKNDIFILDHDKEYISIVTEENISELDLKGDFIKANSKRLHHDYLNVTFNDILTGGGFYDGGYFREKRRLDLLRHFEKRLLFYVQDHNRIIKFCNFKKDRFSICINGRGGNVLKIYFSSNFVVLIDAVENKEIAKINNKCQNSIILQNIKKVAEKILFNECDLKNLGGC